MSHGIMARVKISQFSTGLHLGIKWSTSGPYFDALILVMDITLRSVLWTRNLQCAKHYTHQMSFKYTPFYSLTEATLFWSDARPPYWMKATAVAIISIAGVVLGHKSAISMGMSTSRRKFVEVTTYVLSRKQ